MYIVFVKLNSAMLINTKFYLYLDYSIVANLLVAQLEKQFL